MSVAICGGSPTWRVTSSDIGFPSDGWRRFVLELYVGNETRRFRGKVHRALDRYPWVEFTEVDDELKEILQLPDWKVAISHDVVTTYGLADVVDAFLERLYPPPPADLTGRPDVWLVMSGERG